MASEPDRQEIDRAQGEIDSLQSEIKHLVVDHMLAHKNILTPEQQKQFFDMLKKRFSRDYGERKR
jgi:Spy/CpxP family protein refolding chaperone